MADGVVADLARRRVFSQAYHMECQAWALRGKPSSRAIRAIQAI